MVHVLEFQLDIQLRERVTLRLGEFAVLGHLGEDDVTSFFTSLVKSPRIVSRRVLQHADEDSGFLLGQLIRLFAKINLGGGLNAHSIVHEVELVQVHGDDLLLRVIFLQLGGHDPLRQFLFRTFKTRLRFFGEQKLRQLLGDRTTTSRILMHHERLDGHTEQSVPVYAGMAVIAGILRGDQRVNEIRRQLRVWGIQSILTLLEITSEDLHVA